MKSVAERVFLIHGLWMSGYASLYWRRVAAQAGFNPISFSYPSVTHDLRANAKRLYAEVLRATKDTTALGQVGSTASKVHFVGHSLGGLVILAMLSEYGADLKQRGILGRVVLCGSPVQGSHCARTGASWPVFGKAILGKSILQWPGLESVSLPPELEIGTLAGTRSIGLGRVVPGLPLPNDGTVALSETLLPQARDSVVMHINHSEMLVAPAAGRQIVHFLQEGRFIHRV